MSRVGLIWNQKSHRNQGVGRTPLPDDILDIVPEALHQQIPLVFGSSEEVATFKDFMTRDR